MQDIIFAGCRTDGNRGRTTMKTRIAALTLALVMLFALTPSTASAATISGMTSKVDYDNTDPDRFVIQIDLVNQIITVYEGQNIVLQGLCTTGSSTNPTGSGVFKTGDLKERFGYFVAYGQYAQYWTQVVRGVYIHSIMYDSKKLSSLSSSAYRNLGRNVSHGCVRVLPDVAQWIYYNCPPGTTCNIVKNKAKDAALVDSIRDGMRSYKYYTTYSNDTHTDPPEIPAAVLYDNVPVRTGFSASKDKTVVKLNANDRVFLLQIGADWCKVRTMSGKLGYVMSKYLLCDPDAPVTMHEAYAATKKTYIYESMDTDSKRLITIASGAEVKVSGNPKSGWYEASFGGVTGYARTKYVKLTSTVVFPEVATAPLVDPVTGAPAVNGTAAGPRVRSDINANVRSGPGTEYGRIGTIPAGTAVVVKAVEGNWFYVEGGGLTGYVHANCIVNGG